MGTQSQQRSRGRKGTVTLECLPDRGLRLRWRFEGKRFVLALGMPDSKVNRQVAQAKATQLELDMASGNFDPSLSKYKPQGGTAKSAPMTVVGLFEGFMAFKAKTVQENTLAGYRSALKYLRQFFGEQRSAQRVGSAEAEEFVGWFLKQDLSMETRRTWLTFVNACWQWGMKQNHLEANPWKDLMPMVKVPPKQPPKPFTREEIEMIFQAFRTDRYYSHYADYVEFLFGTGCRTSEAIGLRWKHLNDDCSSVWIGETLTRRKKKPTKNHRARTVTLTDRLQTLLLNRRPDNVDPEALVFLAPRGGPIDDHNFRNRAWVKILSGLGIDYRKPYTTRHTLISHALDLGQNPVLVAQLTGHDVQTLYENYAGSVSSRPRLPDLV